MSVYYNEIEPYCVTWLFNLMLAKLIPAGDVDQRPIQEVTPDDIRRYTQCHFFAGIAGWAYALRLAQWPDDRPIWTGSCPCQPFSVAGKRKGFADDRDLWPAWFRLIRQCSPPVVMGEQVASAADWLARVRSDLEEVGYAVGCLPVQAACAGAAQYRDRFWFVADTGCGQRRPSRERGKQESAGIRRGVLGGSGSCDGPLAERDLQRPSDLRLQRGGQLGGAGGAKGDTAGTVAGHPRKQAGSPGQARQCSDVERPPLDGWGQGWTEHDFRGRGFSAAVASSPDGSVQFIECPDHKWRRLPPPRVRWLGNGIPARVPKLRALGNAIYPPLAAEVIKAYMECGA